MDPKDNKNKKLDNTSDDLDDLDLDLDGLGDLDDLDDEDLSDLDDLTDEELEELDDIDDDSLEDLDKELAGLDDELPELEDSDDLDDDLELDGDDVLLDDEDLDDDTELDLEEDLDDLDLEGDIDDEDVSLDDEELDDDTELDLGGDLEEDLDDLDLEGDIDDKDVSLDDEELDDDTELDLGGDLEEDLDDLDLEGDIDDDDVSLDDDTELDDEELDDDTELDLGGDLEEDLDDLDIEGDIDDEDVSREDEELDDDTELDLGGDLDDDAELDLGGDLEEDSDDLELDGDIDDDVSLDEDELNDDTELDLGGDLDDDAELDLGGDLEEDSDDLELDGDIDDDVSLDEDELNDDTEIDLGGDLEEDLDDLELEGDIDDEDVSLDDEEDLDDDAELDLDGELEEDSDDLELDGDIDDDDILEDTEDEDHKFVKIINDADVKEEPVKEEEEKETEVQEEAEIETSDLDDDDEMDLDEIDEIPEDLEEPEPEIDPDVRKLEALKKIAEMNEANKPEEKEGDEYNSKETMYPEQLIDLELECLYVGMLFNNPKAMSRYYLKYEDCRFSEEELANLYKIVLFRDGEQFAPAIAKDKYQLPRENPNTYDLKLKVRRLAAAQKDKSLERVYRDVKKLFILKKNYVSAATAVIQDEILGILKYELYDEMTVEEVESALEQITVTAGLSQGRLNQDATGFLLAGDNELSNGISIPFDILSTVFKGLRRGETMTYAMPSNSGKSRFTINLAAYISFIHKEKVLIISNEMSAEKMKLCMITTIINNPEIQKLHGQELRITEGELLELKFRPDKGKRVKCDENGYILRKDKEDQEEYIDRLRKNSSDFRHVLEVTEWVNTQVDNSIFFIHITEHTNDDLKKIIMNYYYKEGIHYMFYDTLKADTANIGNSDEVKKTATILSNLAQKFHIFIASSMQLLESSTLPVNLTINDMSASKTVKEVLDTLMLIKQISRASLHKYEYADTDQFEKCSDIDVPKDTDVRFYACVVDKNRAGAKPTVLFKLNLAYNRWVELGHLRLKQENIEED